MEKQTNIPKLRFPEFTGEWEKKKVGELCDFIVPGRNKPTSFNGNIPWITTPDIQHNGIVLYSKKELSISKEEAKKVGSKIVPQNAIIMSCVGDIGIVAIAGTEMVINQQLHAFIPQTVEYRFLLYSLGSQKKYMEKVATKTAVPYMNKDNCNSIPITFPTLSEQQKIATFLTAIDEKLQTLKKKKDLLEEYKKGVMQKLFLNCDLNDEMNTMIDDEKNHSTSKNQKNHSSRLRFKDENGKDFPEWEVKKLGEIGDFQTSRIDKLSRDNEKEVFLVNYMNVYRHENINNTTIKSFQIVTAKESQIESCNLKKGDILFTPSSETPEDIGHSVVIFEDLDNSVFSYHLMRFRPKIKIDILYSHYFCNIPEVLKQLSKLATGSTRFTISVGSFSSVVISLPSLPEQTLIANFLSAIDEKINHCQKQIEQTEVWKKGLLQKMFV